MGLLAQNVALFIERKAIGTSLVVAVFNLLQYGGDADFKEFIEIAGRNGQKFQAFQQRIAFVARFLEHTAIEGEPRNISVEKVFGIV